MVCSTSGSSVSLRDVGCFLILPNYGAMAQALDRPSQIYLGRGPDQVVGLRVCLARQSEIERCLTPHTTQRPARAVLGEHHCEGRDL